MNKKLQVFVSSTYTDLIEERQVAVQAILDAGHIPAGMELFKAGKSQMKTIRKWIDGSDVYMLILGGRYGSIEEESGLSYTELEYKYAISKNMPVFAIVLDDSFLHTKAASCKNIDIFEKDNKEKYETFKEFVKTNVVKFSNNVDQISSVIHAQLNEILNDPDYNLIGWVRNDNENDIIQLLKENHSLNKKTQKLQKQLNAKSKEQFGNYTFDELVDILKNKFFHESFLRSVNAFDFFTENFKTFSSITGYTESCDYEKCKFLEAYNLVEVETTHTLSGIIYQFKISKQGTIFYTLLQRQFMQNNAFE